MKIHLITIGQPKLPYARAGWEEYIGRLKHYHDLKITHLPDKNNDAKHILEAVGRGKLITLEIDGHQMTSPKLAEFLEKQANEGREICFVIGGPEGLQQEVTEKSEFNWSLSELTFPHDLAMVVLAETLYRASTINASQPYHK